MVEQKTQLFQVPRQACKRPPIHCPFQEKLNRHEGNLRIEVQAYQKHSAKCQPPSWIGEQNADSQAADPPFCHSICGRFPIQVALPQIQTPSAAQPCSSFGDQMKMENLSPRLTITSLTCSC